jgi:hypothetical protein
VPAFGGTRSKLVCVSGHASLVMTCRKSVLDLRMLNDDMLEYMAVIAAEECRRYVLFVCGVCFKPRPKQLLDQPSQHSHQGLQQRCWEQVEC